MVALFDASAEPLRRRDREAHLDLAAVERPRHLEACVAEDCEHRRILRKYLRHEALDSNLRGANRELLEQPCGCAPPLKLVCHGEGDLCDHRVAKARVLGDRDDPFAACPVCEHTDQRAAVGPVGVEEVLDERCVDASHPVEAEVQAVLGEPLEEREKGARIVMRGRPQPQGRAVAEDHVHRDGCLSARRRRQEPSRASTLAFRRWDPP